VAGLQHLFAAERKQLPGKIGRAIGAQGDLFERIALVRRQPGARGQQRGVPLDHGEDIVEIVGHSTGELADRFHFLGLAQLVFELAAFRDVAGIHDDAGLTGRILAQNADRLEDAPGAVGMPATELDGGRFFGLAQRAFERLLPLVAVIRDGPIRRPTADQSSGR
jgi:hypothetical protein